MLVKTGPDMTAMLELTAVVTLLKDLKENTYIMIEQLRKLS